VRDLPKGKWRRHGARLRALLCHSDQSQKTVTNSKAAQIRRDILRYREDAKERPSHGTWPKCWAMILRSSSASLPRNYRGSDQARDENPRKLDLRLVDAQQAAASLTACRLRTFAALMEKSLRASPPAACNRSPSASCRARTRSHGFQAARVWTVESLFEKTNARPSGKLIGKDGKPYDKFAIPQKTFRCHSKSARRRNGNRQSVEKKQARRTPSAPSPPPPPARSKPPTEFFPKQTMMLASTSTSAASSLICAPIR